MSKCQLAWKPGKRLDGYSLTLQGVSDLVELVMIQMMQVVKKSLYRRGSEIALDDGLWHPLSSDNEDQGAELIRAGALHHLL